jgi:hypothetical protein
MDHVIMISKRDGEAPPRADGGCVELGWLFPDAADA